MSDTYAHRDGEQSPARSGSPIRRVLCALDFSEGSERALEFAVDLARRAKAELHLVHVYELPVYPSLSGVLEEVPDFIAAIEADVEAGLRRLAEARGAKDARLHVVAGRAAEGIVGLASSLSADAVVMGTEGRTGLERLLLGSVAERVVRTSRVPVFAVPSSEH